MFLGLPLSYTEACRLLHLEPSDDIHSYLRQKESKLSLTDVDKGVVILGIELSQFHIYCFKKCGVDDALLRIVQAKKDFYDEVTKLAIDLRNVALSRMEEKDEIVELAEPLFLCF